MIRNPAHKAAALADYAKVEEKVCALLKPTPTPVGECPYPTSPLPRPHSIHMVPASGPYVLPRRDYAAHP